MKNGFTLIQFILIVAIIGIVAGYFSFKFSGPLNEIKLKSAYMMIASDLRAAKLRAMSEHNSQEIIFKSDQYTSYGKIKILPQSVKIINPQTVKFSASGMPVVGYFGTIIVSCRGKTASIVISSAGRIRIE